MPEMDVAEQQQFENQLGEAVGWGLASHLRDLPIPPVIEWFKGSFFPLQRALLGPGETFRKPAAETGRNP